DLSLVSENTSKVLSDDPDDTSSEHSYSTFHAKESDESSEDESSRVKIVQHKEESKIQIRMFTPQEAPPPSKLKEEATLRESFRRLKIVRTSSVSKDGPVLGRSSLRGLKDTADGHSIPSSHLNAVSEQPQEGSGSVGKPGQNFPTNKPTLPSKDANTPPEMKEILDRLGAPPPYPGMVPVLNPSSVDINVLPALTTNSNNNNIIPEKKEEHLKLPTNTGLSQSQNKQLLTTVKRSSSVGTAPPKAGPVLSAHKEPPGTKPRATTFNLDTVVPVSKPGMVRFNKDSDVGTSVLKSDTVRNPSVSGSESDSIKCLSEKDNSSISDKGVGQDDKDESSDNLASLHDYSIGSDSDSDHERSSSDALNIGPLKMAAMNGLTLSKSMVLSLMNDDSRAPTDDRRRMLESKISEGQVYAEFEQIPRKSDSMECCIAMSQHNTPRNRFKDVLPYDATRVKLSPRRDNPDGYINASHIKV
ncbi:unnamed protein product, partial [Lymnaea stagnalis]